MFFFYLNSNSILSLFHCCITNHPKLGCKTTATYYVHEFYVSRIQRGQVSLLQNVWVLIWECSKDWEWFGWLSVGSWLLHSHVWWLGWVIRRLGLLPECLHMASSCGLGCSQCGSWIWEEASWVRVFHETEAEASSCLLN